MEHKHEVTLPLDFEILSVYCKSAMCTWKLDTIDDLQTLMDELDRLSKIEVTASAVAGNTYDSTVNDKGDVFYLVPTNEMLEMIKSLPVFGNTDDN